MAGAEEIVMPASPIDPASARFADTLLELGFSQYESRCYVGLLGPGPQTGYAVAKATGVPQPKVYEALRKLVSRGVARQLPGEPVLFAAVPPQELLDGLETTFEDRMSAARAASAQLEVGAQPPVQVPVAKLEDRDDVVAAAGEALSSAGQRVYLSATSSELTRLHRDIQGAVSRGVDVVIHQHHQARHIALVVDCREAVFGLAADGMTWSGVRTDNGPIIAAVKCYIRHDVDIQPPGSGRGDNSVRTG